MKTTEKPPFPQPMPGTTCHYNLADVLAHMHGRQAGAQALRQFAASVLCAPVFTEAEFAAMRAEADRVEFG